MTIHEFVNATRLRKLPMAGLMPPGVQLYFPPADTDTFISEDTETYVAINRATGRFSAQRGEFCIMGFSDIELNGEELEALARPSA